MSVTISSRSLDYKRNLHMIPPHMHGSIVMWIEHPVEPWRLGSFLRAVLSNDLRTCIEAGDNENVAALADWIRYLYNYAPSPCWGSPEKLQAWFDAHKATDLPAPAEGG